MRYLLFSIVLFMANTASAQYVINSFIAINILSGSSNATCPDIDGELDNLWGVNIEGTGYNYYGTNGSCELNTQNFKYFRSFSYREPFPESIEICFRAMDFKGSSYCDPIGDCVETICEKIPVPNRGPIDQDKEFHSLCLPKGGDSEGCIEFTILGMKGKYTNVDPCDTNE